MRCMRSLIFLDRSLSGVIGRSTPEGKALDSGIDFVENVKSGRKQSVHRLPAARLGHHAGDRFAPAQIVRRFLVCGRVGG